VRTLAAGQFPHPVVETAVAEHQHMVSPGFLHDGDLVLAGHDADDDAAPGLDHLGQ